MTLTPLVMSLWLGLGHGVYSRGRASFYLDKQIYHIAINNSH
jgi:hypothetical protein